MTFKAKLMDEAGVHRALRRISFEIVEKNHGTDNIVLVGIRRRGVCVAKEIRDNILAAENVLLPLGELDVTFYRDDVTKKTPSPTIGEKDIPFSVTDKTVVLTDDVIFTGRTVRAAIDAIFTLGRPRAIRFAALIDRGHRELPIKAD